MRIWAKNLVGAATALMLCAGAAQAQPVNGGAAVALGQSIASAAASAERGAGAPDAVERSVVTAVQGLIITSAADPKVVLAALDQTLAACRPADGRIAPFWTCPTTGAAFAALSSLRGVVLAQLEQTAPAAIGTRGYAAFGSIPTTSPGGSGYLRP
jgi:hypothetical protein